MSPAEHRVVTLAEAKAAGYVAAARCEAKAKRVADFDFEGACDFIRLYLASYGATSGERLVIAAIASGHRVHDARAYGSVFRTLAARGQIKCLRSDLPRVFGHGTSGGKLWCVV